MIALLVAVLAATFAALTWLAGWWAVPLVALVAGAAWRGGTRAPLVALAATLGWCALLAIDAAGGRLPLVATRTAGVFRMPGAMLMLISVGFAAALAWSAAAVGEEVRRRVVKR